MPRLLRYLTVGDTGWGSTPLRVITVCVTGPGSAPDNEHTVLIDIHAGGMSARSSMLCHRSPEH